MSKVMTRADVEEAIGNPVKVFETPAEVVAADLPLRSKKDILKSWEADAHQLLTASDENMAGGEPSQIDDVRKAIDEIGVDADEG